MSSDLSLTLLETPDAEDGVIHLDTSDIRSLGLVSGDVVAVEGARRAYLAIQPAFVGDRNQRIARVSPVAARNLGSLNGQKIRILHERVKAPLAELVTIQASDDIDQLHILARLRQIGSFWNKRTIGVGDELAVPTLDRFPLLAKVAAVQPQGPVQIGHATEFSVASAKTDPSLTRIGGLRDTYRTCHSFVCARFERSGGVIAKTVLLSGPSGMGKARLVQRLSEDFKIDLHVLDANELLDRAVVQPTALDLGSLLPELSRRGKTILLLDHLEALCRTDPAASSLGLVIHAVTAQLCSLLDDVESHPNIMVFGVSSLDLPPRFLHGDRFDVCLPVDLANRWGRAEAFLLATEGLKLAESVDVIELASSASGLTAHDIFRVVRTASLMASGSQITDFDFSQAMRTIPSAEGSVLCDVPTTMWDEVAGLDDVKQLMYETLIWSLHQYDKFMSCGVRPPRSILLSGGQGTGKTSLVRALAGFIPMHFIEVSCPLLAGRPRDESAQVLKESFALARRKTPCLIFLDDLDVLFEFGGSFDASSHQHPIVAQLLAELDVLATLPGVVVIAATNRPDRLTPDILQAGRFDFAVTLPMPDMAARKRILQIHARKLLLASDIDFDRLAGHTQGMSSAEVANLCNRVGLMALRQSFSSPDASGLMPVVTSDLFDQALRGRKG